MAAEISLGLKLAGEGNIDVVIKKLIIGGLTRRDRDAIEAHLAELADIGVERPSSIPLFYQVAATC